VRFWIILSADFGVPTLELDSPLTLAKMKVALVVRVVTTQLGTTPTETVLGLLILHVGRNSISQSISSSHFHDASLASKSKSGYLHHSF
jgi:hypothetical protein